MRLHLLVLIAFSGCVAHGPVRVSATQPKPIVNIAPRDTALELKLGAGVQDDFVIPESAQLLAVHVTGWHTSVSRGFHQAFDPVFRPSQAAGPKMTLAIDVIRPELVPVVVRRSGGAVMSTSQLQYSATLFDPQGQVVNRTVGTVQAKRTGLETWDQSLESALEAMFEDIGQKLF
jgi:hypothetical protein